MKENLSSYLLAEYPPSYLVFKPYFGRPMESMMEVQSSMEA